MAGWFGVRRKLLEWSKVWGAKKVRALRRYIFSNRIRILKTSIYLQTLKDEFSIREEVSNFSNVWIQTTNFWGSSRQLLWLKSLICPNALLAQRSLNQIFVGLKVLLVQMRLVQLGCVIFHFDNLTKVSHLRRSRKGCKISASADVIRHQIKTLFGHSHTPSGGMLAYLLF